jgi:hypothetical protein
LWIASSHSRQLRICATLGLITARALGRAENRPVRTGQKNRPSDPLANVSALSNLDLLSWLSPTGKTLSARADERATDLALWDAPVMRQGHKYPKQRNVQGHYWFSSANKHVWHESMTEYTALMWLEHHQDIVAIAAQPMCILFADGSRHYPDYMSLHRDGSQVLYDVRPATLIDDAAVIQFAKTDAVARRIGWSYEVHRGVGRIERDTLELLASARNSWHRPTPQLEAKFLGFLEGPRPLDELIQVATPSSPGAVIRAIYWLAWNRLIYWDETVPMSMKTLVRRTESA